MDFGSQITCELTSNHVPDGNSKSIIKNKKNSLTASLAHWLTDCRGQAFNQSQQKLPWSLKTTVLLILTPRRLIQYLFLTPPNGARPRFLRLGWQVTGRSRASTSSSCFEMKLWGCWEDQLGVRSQIENKTWLLSYKDVPMGREQRRIKETKEILKNLTMTE